MVYANKKERLQEKEVCSFIVSKVLNQGNLTRITGITTKSDLEKLKTQKREALQEKAKLKSHLFEMKL